MDKAEKVFIKLSEEYTTPIFSKKKTKYVYETKIGDIVQPTSPYTSKVASVKTKDSEEPKKQLTHTLRNAISGGVAGAIATAATLPLETIQISESVGTGSKKDIIKQLYHEGRSAYKTVKNPETGQKSKILKISNPEFEYLKSKGRIAGKEGTEMYTGVRGTLKGIGRFYKGIDTKLLKVVPTMAITFPVYKYLENKLSKKGM